MCYKWQWLIHLQWSFGECHKHCFINKKSWLNIHYVLGALRSLNTYTVFVGITGWNQDMDDFSKTKRGEYSNLGN